MKKIVILPFLVVAFIGCNYGVKDEQEKEESVTVQQENHQHDEIEAIVLDNGKKWKVVDSMAVYIRTMEKAVADFETADNNDYKALAQTVDVNIHELTASCTMKGQAHDELHKWLVPFIELSEKFDEATEISEQEKIYQEFKASFNTYNTYFE